MSNRRKRDIVEDMFCEMVIIAGLIQFNLGFGMQDGCAGRL